MLDIILLVIAIVAIIILVYSEYVAHDCIPSKMCNHSVPKPTSDDDVLTYIDKIRAMVQNNYDYVAWRQALLVALVLTVPIVYYLKSRIPNLAEWLIIGGIIFIGVYLSSSWIWAHFFYPNGNQIEKNLLELRDKVHNLTFNTSSTT